MKKFLMVVVMIVVTLGWFMIFSVNPVEVKGLVPATLWDRFGNGFELSSVSTALPAPVQKETWNRFGSGFELTSVQATLSAPVQKGPWNRYGSGFELSSVRTADEIKASIDKYMWNRAGSGFELTSLPGALPASEQK